MSTWRDNYKVHPAANVFPMMSDEELAKARRGHQDEWAKRRSFCSESRETYRSVLDGRNRLEAMERVGLEPKAYRASEHPKMIQSPLSLGLNIHRRHLTKQQQADLIVAAVKAGEKLAKLAQFPLTDFGDQLVDGINELVDQLADGSPHIKGGRGKQNAIKEKALAINAALPKEQQVSEPTIKRAIAKAEGKTPAA